MNILTDEAKKWKGLTAIGLVVVLAYGIYTFTGEGHESHGERPVLKLAPAA